MVLIGRKVQQAERRLIRESEAFLRGRALQGLWTRNQVVPEWAHINWLAHADPSEILARAREELGLRRPEGSWPWATSTLAHELFVDSGESGDTVRQLQRDCIIPIELALISTEQLSMSPAHCVWLAVLKLRAHPLTHRPRGGGS
jgi:hypothetical protein